VSDRNESMLRPVAARPSTRSALLLLRRLSGCLPALGARLTMGWPAYFGRSMPTGAARPISKGTACRARLTALMSIRPGPTARCGHAVPSAPGTKQFLCDGSELPRQGPIGVGFRGRVRRGFVTGSGGSEGPTDRHRMRV
jgi:hypothetical protein